MHFCLTIDHRSFADQRIAEQPTIHEGYIAQNMEKKGMIADHCEINRQIRADNQMLRELKTQVSKMLVTEGFLYLGGAFVIAVLLIVFGAKQILVNTLGTAFFFRLHLTIVPCVLMIPILVGIAYVIPKYQFEKMSRESIVERIRKE